MYLGEMSKYCQHLQLKERKKEGRKQKKTLEPVKTPLRENKDEKVSIFLAPFGKSLLKNIEKNNRRTETEEKRQRRTGGISC